MADYSVAGLPDVVVVEHMGSDKRFELPLKWDARGIAETGWKIPEDANLGEYQVSLTKKSKKKNVRNPGLDYNSEQSWPSGSFRVEEFRVPLMKGIIQTPKQPAVNVPDIEVDLMVAYLAGGGAGLTRGGGGAGGGWGLERWQAGEKSASIIAAANGQALAPLIAGGPFPGRGGAAGRLSPGRPGSRNR